MQQWNGNDAPILIVMGQSNAHGHGTVLPETERMTVPLTHVFGLARAHNQSFDAQELLWSGFQSGGMNLGETQDHTVCLAGEFARIWQNRINAGEQLPALYIIQISIGAQGIAAEERDGLNMWYPQRTPVLHPGPLATVDISLYPLAVRVLSMAVRQLRDMGKKPMILGLHWNQWETEVFTGGTALQDAPDNYKKMFLGFADALAMEYPLWLYEPLSYVYENDAGLAQMHALFEAWSSAPHVHLMRTSRSPFYTGGRADQGIFLPDCVHYTPQVHRWFAKQQEIAVFGEEC